MKDTRQTPRSLTEQEPDESTTTVVPGAAAASTHHGTAPIERGRHVRGTWRPEGDVIGERYLVEEALARGGMGEVVLARDKILARRVAVKRGRDGLSPAKTIRIRREALITASIEHRSIVQAFDMVTDQRGDHLVMEYVSGPSLRILHELGAIPHAGAIRIAAEIASGLAAIHDRGVVHLDLKLENVLIANDGQPKIIDFGIARCAELPARGLPVESSFVETGIIGTPRAMSPEQIAGREVDARSDLFSLGVLMYELLSGKTPFGVAAEPETLQRVAGHRPPALLVINEVPPALSQLVEQLLEKDPALRPQSAAEVLVRLRALTYA